MNRRDLLKYGASVPLLMLAGRLFAAPAGHAKLLVVFLRGGYDAANLLVPISSPFYYEARPNIAIPRPDSSSNTALPLNTDWGLHPALQDTIYPLFQNRQAAFVPFAGTEDLSRSHFETQDTIEIGQTLGTHRNFQSGFLNRLVTVLNDAKPISFTDQLPIVFRGKAEIPNTSLNAVGKPGIDSRQSSIIAQMYHDSPLATQVNEGFEIRDEVMEDLAIQMQKASRGAMSPKGFEQEASRVAQLMRDRFDVGFIDVGGWDTHVGEGSTAGYFAGRVGELGRGLSAFAKVMDNQWQNTVVVIISEFGRTFRENGNHGTDHGHGSVYWVLGGRIQGGKIAGEQLPVEQETLLQNRDYPVLNEYRAVFAGLFARMYSLNSSEIDKVFPGARSQDIGLL